MSAPAFEEALARLYTDASYRDWFLREPMQALQEFSLTLEESSALRAIDRTGLLMAARSFASKKAKRRPPRARILSQFYRFSWLQFLD